MTQRQEWLNSLKVGDRVLAGGYVELRMLPTDPSAEEHGVVVRWINPNGDGTWWGWSHSRVPVSQLQPWPAA